MSILLPNIISDGMVIEKNCKIWGWATEEKEVKIVFCNKTFVTQVNNGFWELNIEVDNFGGPYFMYINDIEIKDVYVGYVFLCSGQSNMELPISRVRIIYEEELKKVENTNIRAFYVEKNNAFCGVQDNCLGNWKYANETNINEFFALSYFFAKDLEKYLNVPIGLINCAVGGSNIKSWLSEEILYNYPNDYEILKTCQKENYVKDVEKNDLIRVEEWHRNVDSLDIGLKEGFINLSECRTWGSREVTKSWTEDIGVSHGTVWFKTFFYVDEKNLNKDARLFLGTLVDSDVTYINGVMVGATGYQYPPRIYNINKSLLKKGENCVTVRLFSQNGLGGFTVDKEHKVVFDDGTVTELQREWYYKIGCKVAELEKQTFFWGYPTGLYNGMLYPVLNYSYSGFLWYQGESNTNFPNDYDELLGRLLNQIRDNLGDKTPFVVVQLPNFEAYNDNEKWEVIRQKQETILNFKSTALIKTLGLGEDNDLHPLNKKDIGNALSDAIKTLKFGEIIENPRVVVSK